MSKLKRIFACSFILAVLPLFTSPIHDSSNPAPFATVAFAGHVNSTGRYCDCGCPVCTCDPGEPRQICEQSRLAPPATTDDSGSRSHSMTGNTDHSSVDLGSSALLLVLGVLLWARLRA